MIRRLKKILTGKSAIRTVEELKSRYGKMINIAPDVRLENFELEIRKPVHGHVFFSAGKGCVLSGKFVLETEESTIQIGENTFLGGGLFISLRKIEIGSDVMFSWGCTVIDNDAHSLISSERQKDVSSWKKSLEAGSAGLYKSWDGISNSPVEIGDKCWVGFNSIILKGVRLEEGVVVGAGSVVTRSFPRYSVIAGNPARKIKETI
ncbi:MAG TPA: acyltransferase [Bacteroidia bacterium]|nr:acyltransferase [Bacteroidia bacterium]